MNNHTKVKKDSKFTEERLAYLEEVNRFTMDALEIAASLGDFHKNISEFNDYSNILEPVRTRVKQLIHFETTAFFLVNEEDSDFYLFDCDPKGDARYVQDEVDLFVSDGTFSRALADRKSIITYSSSHDRTFLLHVMSTESRVRGLFVGVLRQRSRDIQEAALALLSITMINTAKTLEGFELYNYVRQTNKDLEVNVKRLSESERELAEHRNNLEGLVTQRTGELTDVNAQLMTEVTEHRKVKKELKNSKQRAEVANTAKSDFLAHMSHEIRTPMNGIIGIAGLMLDTKLNEEQKDYLDIIRSSADSLLSIINDILDFSKIEAGKMDLETTDFDLRSVLAGCVELLKIKAQEKGLRFFYQIEHDVHSLVRGDPGRLHQILINFSGNAIKFTETGEVGIRVALEKEDSTHVTLKFLVKDTGIGISDKSLKRVFEPFLQADASTTRKHGGTGLGLSISKQLAEMMGGEIGVESQEGKGSTFWFTAVFEKQILANRAYPEFSGDIQGKRFLAVDGSRNNLDVLHAYFNAWGCVCDTAENTEKALTSLREGVKAGVPHDLILIDMNAPGMGGTELGRVVKEDPAIEAIKMVMLTERGLRGDAAMMKKIGFDAYLPKPVERSQLYDGLVAVFSNIEPPHSEQLLVTRHTISEAKKQNVRILLAEDNIVNQKLAMKLLDKFGFSADIVTNGKEAVKALEAEPYDIVLMDIQMPEMDGVEATKVIRDPNSHVKRHDVSIIAMTANAMKGDKEKYLAAGMDSYISKPINPEALRHVVEEQISAHPKQQT